MISLVADFETILDNDSARVWAWALCDIPYSKCEYGNSIDSFFERVLELDGKRNIYFHNLKFDGSYIINYLLKNDWDWVKNKKSATNKSFTTLISDIGQYYSIRIFYSNSNGNLNTIEFLDSLKIIPLKVSQIARAFKLDVSKGEIDYKKFRPIGYTMDEEEKDYIMRDVKIVANALYYFFNQGLVKMTQGSNALEDYKKIIGKKKYKMLFPKLALEVDKDIRRAYKGGFVWVNPKFKNKIIKRKGYVIDYNSLYPSVMYTKKFPYSQPVFFEGQYTYDKNYTLYIQHLRCQFELKKGFIPTIQAKGNYMFVQNEYLENSKNEIVDLYLTNVDLCLFFEHYEVYNVEFINGWKFRAQYNLFHDYIKKWSNIKVNSKKEGNAGMTQIAKLMLNSLYGKFGTNPIKKSKKPVLIDGVLHYEMLPEEEGSSGYIPMACFITAYARNETIRAAQKIYETGNYIYSDTDSIHAFGELPDFLPIDDKKLCHWKQEFTIKYCKYIRQKTYVDYGYEPNSNKLKRKITVAAMPDSCKYMFRINSFNVGKQYKNKLVAKQVNGGIELVETEFTLKVDNFL